MLRNGKYVRMALEKATEYVRDGGILEMVIDDTYSYQITVA